MPSDIKKFINPKFLRTIELDLMHELFSRHFKSDEMPVAFDGEPAAVRQALTDYFEAPVTEWSEGVVADLHRVAEVGTGEGLQLILNEARRQNVVLYPDEEAGNGEDAPARHDAKHVALHTYLHHHRVFEAAADFQALRAPSAMAEFRGPWRHVDADLTEDTKSAFRTAIMKLLAQDLQGEYCRVGQYEEDGEINLVVSHGAPVTTTPVVAGDREEIITLRAVKYAAVRYSPAEGLLRIGGVAKARQADMAEAFAEHILAQPGFFAGKDARDLYTLDPISEAGPDFAFDHAFDDRILGRSDRSGCRRPLRTRRGGTDMALRAQLGVAGRLRRRAEAFPRQRGALRARLAAGRDHVPGVLQDGQEAARAGHGAPETARHARFPPHPLREGGPRPRRTQRAGDGPRCWHGCGHG